MTFNGVQICLSTVGFYSTFVFCSFFSNVLQVFYNGFCAGV